MNTQYDLKTDAGLKEFARAIASLLTLWDTPRKWAPAYDEPEAYDRPVYIKSTDGLEVRITFKQREGKIRFSGYLGKLTDYMHRGSNAEVVPAIMVSATRSAFDIAKDVNRRLIPQYRALKQTLLQRHRERMDELEDAHEFAESLVAASLGYAELLQGKDRIPDYDRDSQQLYLNRRITDELGHGVYFTARVSTYKTRSVYIDRLEVPPDLMPEFMGLLGRYIQRKEKEAQGAAK
jgi:hypothetical protein